MRGARRAMGLFFAREGGRPVGKGGLGGVQGTGGGGGGEYVCDFRYVLWFETDESCCAHGVDVCVSFCGLFFG